MNIPIVISYYLNALICSKIEKISDNQIYFNNKAKTIK